MGQPLLRDPGEPVVGFEQPAVARITDERVAGVIGRDAMAEQCAIGDPEEPQLAAHRYAHDRAAGRMGKGRIRCPSVTSTRRCACQRSPAPNTIVDVRSTPL